MDFEGAALRSWIIARAAREVYAYACGAIAVASFMCLTAKKRRREGRSISSWLEVWWTWTRLNVQDTAPPDILYIELYDRGSKAWQGSK